MKKLASMMALILLLALSACGGADTPELKRYQAEFIGLFDTLTQVIGYAESQTVFEGQIRDLKEDLESYHRLYDIYQSYPGIINIRDINQAAGRGPLKVDPKIIDMLLFAKEGAGISKGRVNIALGSVLAIWHDYREAGKMNPDQARLPDRAILEEANRHSHPQDLVIDPVNGTVEILDPLLRLDVGAVAKGYAVEQAARAAEDRGVAHMLISVGGNVRAIGTRAGEAGPWRVGIDNPDPEKGDYLTVLSIDGLSVVTSGVYERYYRVDGRSYHHIIDPDSLFPENRYLSVSLVCPDSGLADLLSTALFNMDLQEGLAFIEGMEGVEALWCLPDGELVRSSGLSGYE